MAGIMYALSHKELPHVPPTHMGNLDHILGLKRTKLNLGTANLKSSTRLYSTSSAMDVVRKKQQQTVNNTGTKDVKLKNCNESLVDLSHMQYHMSVPSVLPKEQTLVQQLTVVADTLSPPESPRKTELVFTMLKELRPHGLVKVKAESPSRSSMEFESESVVNASFSDSCGCYSEPECIPTSDVKSLKRRQVTKRQKLWKRKEGNRLASIRHRLKKKKELEDILGGEKQLRQRNQQLKTELDELERKITYTKTLFKNLIK